MWGALVRMLGGGKPPKRHPHRMDVEAIAEELAAQRSSASVIEISSTRNFHEALSALRRITQERGFHPADQNSQRKNTLEKCSPKEKAPGLEDEFLVYNIRDRGDMGRSLDLEAFYPQAGMLANAQAEAAAQRVLFPMRQSTGGAPGWDASAIEESLAQRLSPAYLQQANHKKPPHHNLPAPPVQPLNNPPLPQYAPTQAPAVALYVAPDAPLLHHIHVDATAEVRACPPKPPGVGHAGAPFGPIKPKSSQEGNMYPQLQAPQPLLALPKPPCYDLPGPPPGQAAAAAVTPMHDAYNPMRPAEPGWQRLQQQQQQQQQPGRPPHLHQLPPIPLQNLPPARQQQQSDAAATDAAAAAEAMQDLDALLRSQPQKPVIIRFDELKVEEQVGEGGFGKVYKGYWRSNMLVAIKVANLQGQNSATLIKEFSREVQAMSALPPHDNVMRLVAACTQMPRLALVTDYHCRGSLYHALHTGDRPLKLVFVLEYAHGIAAGMVHLHAHHVLHRDLKSANVLIGDRGQPKIADFGLAKLYHQATALTGGLGTYQWMAPEVLSHQRYTEKADVYGFAIVVWECLTRKLPYRGMAPMQAAMGVVNSGLRPELPASTPPGLAKLVRACWSASPEERPSFVEIQAQLACMMKEAERQERQQGGINNAAAAAAANNACVGAALLSPGQLA